MKFYSGLFIILIFIFVMGCNEDKHIFANHKNNLIITPLLMQNNIDSYLDIPLLEVSTKDTLSGEYFILKKQSKINLGKIVADIEQYEITDSFNLIPYEEELSDFKSFIRINKQKIFLKDFFSSIRKVPPYNYFIIKGIQFTFNNDLYFVIEYSHLYTGTNSNPELGVLLFIFQEGKLKLLNLPKVIIQDNEYAFDDLNEDGKLDFIFLKDIYKNTPIAVAYTLEDDFFEPLNGYYAKFNNHNLTDSINWFFEVKK